MDASSPQTRRAPAWIILVGVVLFCALALVLGFWLPGFQDGFDRKLLFAQDWGEPLHFDQDVEGSPDLVQDEAGYRISTLAGCAILDIGDLRIAMARVRQSGQESAAGKVPIAWRKRTSDQPVLDQKRFVRHRVDVGRFYVEMRLQDGKHVLDFNGLVFGIRKRALHHAYAKARRPKKYGIPIDRGPRMLIVDPDGRVLEYFDEIRLEGLEAYR